MHDGMQYDPIQGQGHEPLKVGNPAIFKGYLFRHLRWELASDHGLWNKYPRDVGRRRQCAKDPQYVLSRANLAMPLAAVKMP